MATVVSAIGGLMALGGLVGLVSPSLLRRISTRFREPPGIHIAVSFRLLMGVLLLAAASSCRPDRHWVAWVVGTFGAIVLLAAVVLLVLGKARFRALVDWATGLPASVLRSTSVVAILMGAFLIWAGL